MSRQTGQGNPTTRARILEVAWRLVGHRGVERVSVAEVAEAAGISRQAVYLHFGSRAGVFLAMVRHRDHKSRVAAKVAAALGRPSAEEALTAYVRWWCGYIPDILPVARALEAAAVTDAAAKAAWEDRMDALRRSTRMVMTRLADERRLAKGWTVERASEWCWAQLQISHWHHLVNECGWSPRAYTERLISTLLTVLVRE